ncbi:MAG: hypothetical protein EXQ87_05430 [Alphaproteobacteria bacterium]|nr:hypothetical protein [Alphaproteobacteria bacterium]
MAALDRGEIVRLLERLGDPADGEALAAARALHRTIQEAGVAWEALLADPETGEESQVPDAPVDTPEVPQGLPVGETKADLALIERMLAGFDLSDTARDDLTGLKDDIERGEFTEQDRRFINGLHSRLANKR